MLSMYRTVLACLLSSTALAATSADDLSKFSQTIFLPWTSPFSRASTYTPSVRGSILGKSFDFPIDTGSTGVLISASLLPSVKLGDQNPTGWEFLTSSDILYNGRFVDLDISFFGSNGDQATSRVPVLVVTKIVKCPGYDVTNGNGVCPPEKLDQKWSQTPRTVLYMGVGFGRNVPGSGIPYGTPDHNPFINVVRLSKYKELSIQQGYTVSTNGVYLGLTEGNTKGAVWQQLQNMAGSDPHAWAPPLVSFKYDNSNNPVQAQALIDTGVTQMYIQSTPEYPLPNVAIPNPNPSPGELRRVKPGTKLSFAFPDFKIGEAGYDFVVGDTEFPSQPSYVQPVSSGSGPFVNTGRNFLYGFSIAFDAIAGRYGLICEKCGGDKGKGDAGPKPPQEPKPIEQPKPTQKPQPPQPKPPQRPKPIQKPKPLKPTRPPAKKPPKAAGNWWDEYENLYIGKDGKPITKDKPTVVDQTKGDNLGTWWNAYKGYYDQKEEASNEGVD